MNKPIFGNITASTSYEAVSMNDVDGIAPTAVVPNFYYIHPINEKMAVGVSAYSNFGTGTEFKSNYEAQFSVGKPVFKV